MKVKIIAEISRGNGTKLQNPTELNVIVGRNGSGKSRFLRDLSALRDNEHYAVSYLSPERAGEFSDDPNVEHNVRLIPRFLDDDRNKNQSVNFKKASKLRLKQLAGYWGLRVDRVLEIRSDETRTFETEYLTHINQLLSNVVLERDTRGEFRFVAQNGDTIDPAGLSSGESEVVALASEVMHFFAICDDSKTNLLILDEPDVHLHPDLQAKFARFLISQIERLATGVRAKTYTILATHSTPLICDLALANYCSIGTKEQGNSNVLQRPVAEAFKSVAPFFGHPLSRFIGNDIPLIVEGEDDVRVWGQACRTSDGAIRVFPCLATSKPQLNALEKTCDHLMRAIYDDPKALSIRDGDGQRQVISPEGCVARYVLQCYEMENLLLTDECLADMGTSWDEFRTKAEAWISEKSDHPEVGLLRTVIDSPERGRDRKLKDLRNIIIGITGVSKDWEVVVGQALGRLAKANQASTGPFSLSEFVGSDALLAVRAIKVVGEEEQPSGEPAIA